MSSILLQYPENPKVEPNWRPWRAKRGTLSDFLTSIVAKHHEIEGDLLGIFLQKKSQCRKKMKGDLLGFFNIQAVAKHQKFQGVPFEENFFKKVTMPKKLKVDPLVLPGTVCYAEKSFWFSSPGQIVQFDTIIFRRTFVELFWSVRVDWKKSL